MNITERSAKDWLNVTLYDQNNGNSSSGNRNTINSNNSASAVDSNQGSSSPQIWDLRWFSLLSGPLLFGTIILPLIIGPAVRYLCQSYVTLRVYWRIGFALLAIAYPILYYSLAFSGTEDRFLLSVLLRFICDTTFAIFMLYQFFYAWRLRRRRLVWTLCALLVPGTVWFFDRLSVLHLSFGFFGWVGVILISEISYRREGITKRRADIRAL